MPRWPEQTFTAGPVALVYVEGPRSGPPLVLLHGMTAAWRAWIPLFAPLAPRWHVQAVDLRGHGGSGRAERYHLDDYVADLVAFVAQRLDEPATLVGHSLGALVALGVAAARPDRARAAILVDPPIYLRDGAIALRPEIRAWLELAAQGLGPDAILAGYRALRPGDPHAAFVAGMIAQVDPGVARAALDGRLTDGAHLARLLGQVRSPLTLVHGDWDAGAVVRDEDAAFVAAHCPGAHIVRIPDADHQIPVSHAARLVEIVDGAA